MSDPGWTPRRMADGVCPSSARGDLPFSVRGGVGGDFLQRLSLLLVCSTLSPASLSLHLSVFWVLVVRRKMTVVGTKFAL
ncbi:hypothetical protein FQA47_014462 [Oryzias melastigma]|uniref:Uncharacterized protein n=1 Tax=Oryzias melastigma TaxID=30732 RepID=A0A834C3U1_ORYME|nr:hypothetical protein FQA47_014462 [Oryzias melastigma]